MGYGVSIEKVVGKKYFVMVVSCSYRKFSVVLEVFEASFATVFEISKVELTFECKYFKIVFSVP